MTRLLDKIFQEFYVLLSSSLNKTKINCWIHLENRKWDLLLKLHNPLKKRFSEVNVNDL